MPDVFDENRISDPTWDLPDVNKDGTLEPNLVSESAENVFTINDVVLKIPPTHISIRNEDLVWKWKTLRTKNSTKIASGHGMCEVVLDIVFTPELLLHLHRLVVQFNHSPFCWVRNRFLRESIVPTWGIHQSMGFTMTSFNIASVRGLPGTYRVQLALRWFNYAPYGQMLYRQEWRTRPVLEDSNKGLEYTIPRFVTNREGGVDQDSYLTEEQITFEVPNNGRALRSWNPISYDKDIHGGYTLQQLKENHLGEVFDLLPLPKVMKPSVPISDPAQSNIYVRYINSLQQQALFTNFGINVHQDLIDYPIKDVPPGHPDHPWEIITVGERQGAGLVRGLHTANVPRKVRGKWIGAMSRTTKTTSIGWEEYVSLDLGPDINRKILENYRKQTAEQRKSLRESLYVSEADVNVSAENLQALVAGNPELTIRSPFGLREHPLTKKIQQHNGVDIAMPENTPLLAVATGKVIESRLASGWGGTVVVEHADFQVRYAHLNNYQVLEVGTEVSPGDIVGYSGGAKGHPNAGRSTGPHLHVEFVQDGQEIDPIKFLANLKRLVSDTSIGETEDPYYDENLVELPREPLVFVQEEQLPPNDEISAAQQTNPEFFGGLDLDDVEAREYLTAFFKLIKDGYTLYEEDTTIQNVFSRVQYFVLSNNNHDYQWNPNDTEKDGYIFKEDMVVTNVAGGLQHIVASIPLLGHEYPTHQHLGSIEPTYAIEFTSLDKSLDGLSDSAQVLQGIRAQLQKNARNMRIIPDSSCMLVDNFITRLLGSYQVSDLISNAVDERIEIMKRFMVSRTETQTIEGLPGTSAITWDIDETNPYMTEYITPADEFGETEDIEVTRKEIIQALEKAGTSGNLNDLAAKQVLINLGTTYQGIDALRSISPAAADYFENLEDAPDGARTFTIYSANNQFQFRADSLVNTRNLPDYPTIGDLQSHNFDIKQRPSGAYYNKTLDRFAIGTGKDTAGQYTEFAAQNGITARVGEGLTGSPESQTFLNFSDVTDLAQIKFGSPVYERFNYNTGEFKSYKTREGPLEVEQTGSLSRIRTEPGYTEDLGVSYRSVTSRQVIIETTSYTNLQIDPEIEERAKQYGTMLQMIKTTAEMILAEEALNGYWLDKNNTVLKNDTDGEFNYDNTFTTPSQITYTEKQVSEALYDLKIRPSMYGSFLHYFYKRFWKQFFGTASVLSSQVDHHIELMYDSDPWLDIENTNPELAKFVSSQSQDADFGILQSAATGILDLGEALFDFGFNICWTMRGDYTLSDAVIDQRVDQNTSWANRASNGYYFKFPLSSGVWGNYVSEGLFGGIESKLNADFKKSQQWKIGTYLDSFTYWLATEQTSIKRYNLEHSQNKMNISFQDNFKEYWFGVMARSAGFSSPNLESMTSNGYLWDLDTIQSAQSQSTRTEVISAQSIGSPEFFNFSVPPYFADLSSEKAKLAHILGLLQGLADLIRADFPVMEFLGVTSDVFGAQDIRSSTSGTPCYPDLNLPSHPYYKNALYAMDPDFYYWSAYDDATGSLSAALLKKAEEATRAGIKGPYEALKKMQKDGMDPSEYADVYGILDSGESDITVPVTKLQSHYEGSDEVDMGLYPDSGDKATRVWVNVGETHTPALATKMFTDDTQKELSPEYRQYLKAGEDGFKALEDEIKRIFPEGDSNAPSSSARNGGALSRRRPASNSQRERALESLKQIKAYHDNRQAFMPLLSNWHGNPAYRPVGPELEQYKQLAKVGREVEAHFGSRMGFVGAGPDERTDADSGLTDTRLASLDAYATTFKPESLERLAIESSKDILSQKQTMKRAFPTFKLYFIEEDAIYNRILSFDDFYSYNGVKEFTVHQSRKSPADTATIVLQNISGTLDGTKRNVITDADYFKLDETGNYEDPTKKLDKNTQSNIDGVNGNLASEIEERPNRTTPSWVDNRDQPFGAVILRPGLNVQLRAGYSNDPGMLNVLISGRITDVQWNSNGDLVEIVVQSFGTELVKYIKGNTRYVDGEVEADKIYPTTHHLLSSMMLSPELKHFGRWTRNGIFQYGESKDASVDFHDYAADSYYGNFKVTDSITRWLGTHPVYTAIGTAAIGIALSRLGPIAKPVLGKFAARAGISGWVAKRGLNLGTAGNYIGGFGVGKYTIGNATQRFLTSGAGGQLGTLNGLGKIRSVANTGGSITGALRALKNTGAFNGITGRILYNRALKQSRAYTKALRAGDDAAREAALNSLARIESTALYSQAVALQIGLGSTTANVMTLSAGPILRRLVGGGIKFGFIGVPYQLSKAAVVTFIGLGAVELATRTVFGFAYDNTIGAYKRHYAVTKSKLFLSPQDDNLYPPSPKDYMHLDYESIFTLSGIWKIGKKATFGVVQAVGSSIIGSDLPQWSGDDKLENWWGLWKGGEQPPHVLEKRVSPAQCQYVPDNTTIWEIFYEMTLRHPGWIFGTRPYGTRFRYTMFFGVPSQRYWAKPASNNFIYRSNKLRDYIDVGLTEESFTNLYGKPELERIKAITASTMVLAEDKDYIYTTADGVIYDRYKDIPDVSAETIYAVESSNESYLHHVGVYETHLVKGIEDVPLEAYAAGGPNIDEKYYKELLKVNMTNKAMEEYLLGLEQRFVPFRRYHYLTSNTDIVHNGIISSNHKVANAVSVVYQDPRDDATDSNPEGVTELKASSFIPEEEINMVPIAYRNCRGYTMSLRYGIGALLYGMRDMYRGELMVLGNPRIRPWDICIIRDEYNDMVGPVEVEAVVHMFSHETGFLTEIKPNAVVMANEISSYPILSALQMMCMAVEDNRSAKSASASSLTEEEKQMYTSDRWSEDLKARYSHIFDGDGSALEQIFPQWENNDAAQALSVWGQANIENWDQLFDTGVSGVGYSVAALSGGTAALGTAWGYKKGFFPKTKSEALGVLAAGAAVAGTSVLLTETIKSSSLTWFMAAPILFAKALEEEVVSVMPLTKNGIPIVAGMSLKDPAMMWRHMFGRLYNYAQDTAIGLQDMAWVYNMYGDNWWESYVAFSAPEGFAAIRQDFADGAR